MAKKHRSYTTIILIVVALLVASIFVSVSFGRYPIGIKELCGIFLSKFVDIESFWKPVQESLLLQHRLPRIVLACLVGCSLTAAGAAFGAALAILLNLGSTLIVVLPFVVVLYL